MKKSKFVNTLFATITAYLMIVTIAVMAIVPAIAIDDEASVVAVAVEAAVAEDIAAPEEVPVCEHDFDRVEVIKEPTCSEHGVCEYHCALCGETVAMDIAMESHTVGYAWTDDPNGANTATLNCTECGAVYYGTEYDPQFAGVSPGEKNVIAGFNVYGTLIFIKDRVVMPIVQSDNALATGVGAVLSPSYDNVLWLPPIVPGVSALPTQDYSMGVSITDTNGNGEIYESTEYRCVTDEEINELAEQWDLILVIPDEGYPNRAILFTVAKNNWDF